MRRRFQNIQLTIGNFQAPGFERTFALLLVHVLQEPRYAGAI